MTAPAVSPLVASVPMVTAQPTMTLATSDNWLDRRHPQHSANIAKWRFVRDHYTAEVLNPECATRYLIRKAQSESLTAYEERVALADYTPHFATVVDALAGMLFAVEGDAKRFLGSEEKPGLGEPEDDESAMHRLWQNADGHGTGWPTFFKTLAIELTAMHRAWIVVDQDASEHAVVRMWPAAAVLNWWHDPTTGQLAEVLVIDTIDRRTGVRDEIRKIESQYVLYTLDGWERWRSENGKATQVDGKAWARPFVDVEGTTILPIFPAELPLKRHVGWVLAKKANAIFNRESERDHLLRACNMPYLNLVAEDDQFDDLLNRISRGGRALQQHPEHPAHSFVAPDSGPATVATEVLKRKVEEFYVVAFREYGDAAREKTATEVAQDVASGVGAYLQLLAAAVDDAENNVLLRVAQIEHPNDDRRWFANHVKRSDTFVPTDVQDVIETMKTRYFKADRPLPVGPTALLNVAKQIAQYDGIQFEEGELKAAIMVGELDRLRDIMRDLPFPAEIRVQFTLDLLVALGKIDPDAKETMDDGGEQLVIDAMRQKMLELAMADDEARRRMAQPLDIGPPQPGGPPPPTDDEDDPENKPRREAA